REVYDAIIEYVATGTVIEMQPLARMAFDFIRYEIDEKARRKEARLAKKQQKEDRDNTVTTTETPVEEIPSAPVAPLYDPDKITDEYLASGRAPEPFTITKGSREITMEKKLIRKFVKLCAIDVISRNRSKSHREILSALDCLVFDRYERIQQDIMDESPSTEFTDDRWDATISYACTSVLA
ncbi:MAG: hypothetical protein K2H50_10015, partial [Paramuribaculum sp.]|nr:hypothetical protein [Paramuribaculum sp.]